MKQKRKVIAPPAKIGIIGGGQLGRMLTLEAKRMGYYVIVLDPKHDSPAAQVADEYILSDYSNSKQIKRLAEATEIITYELEHINADILCKLEADDYLVIPSGRVLRKIQNKYMQKTILRRTGLPVPDFWKVNSKQEINQIINTRGLPLVLKASFGGYDGKGNAVIRKRSEIEGAIKHLGCKNYYIEEYVDFIKELSIIISVDEHSGFIHYPVVENVHEDSILRLTRAPADINNAVKKQIIDIAKKVADTFGGPGLFCIELFMDGSNRLYINEIAPRPHNSGHYTIEACITSQYEQLIRILTGMPLGSAELISPCVMANILGDDDPSESSYHFEGIDYALSYERLYIHLYGKQKALRLRKLGHLTVLSECVKNAERIVIDAISHISVVRE